MNRQLSLDTLLSSFASQISQLPSHLVTEIIVIDDGSNTPLQNKYPSSNITLYRLNNNRGAPIARKFGIKQASGKFIHFHDSDDDISENWLSQVTHILADQPSIDILLTSRVVISNQNEMKKAQHFVERFKHNPKKIRERLRFNNCLGPLGGVTFSSKAAAKLQFNNIPSCQDWDMYLDAIDNNSVIVTTSSTTFIKNESSNHRISNSYRKKLRGFFILGRIHGITEKNNVWLRLFYVHSVKRKFATENLGLLDNFYQKHRLKIWLAFLYIELVKITTYIRK